MSRNVLFHWCDGGILRHIQLEKASLAYRSIMAIIATEREHQAAIMAQATVQTTQADANGQTQPQAPPTAAEGDRSAAAAPREDASPGLGPSVKKSPKPPAARKTSKVRNGNRAQVAQCDGVGRKKPKTAADVPEEPLPKKAKTNGVGAYGGPLPATTTAPQGAHSGTNENVAPTAHNGVVKNEGIPTVQTTAQPAQAMTNGSAQLDSTTTSSTLENRSAAVAPRTRSPALAPSVRKGRSPARSPATITASTTAQTAHTTAQPAQAMPNGSAQLGPTPTSTSQENRSAAAAPRTTSPARGPHVRKGRSPARPTAANTGSGTTAKTSLATVNEAAEAMPNGSAQLSPTTKSSTLGNRGAAAAPRTISPARGSNVRKGRSPARSAKVRNGNGTHRVQCDGCAAKGSDDPIVGVRYKCAVCEHFDLCAKCEQRGVHDHHVMLRFGRVADKILNWSMDGRELHENLVKLQQQVYPPAQNDGDGRPVDVHRDSGAVHDVTCKECGNQVVGVRYKCGVCSNHDICSECEANGVHDKHIMFRFAGAVNEVTSWKQVERRFAVKLVDELKSLQHKVAGTTGAKPPSKDGGPVNNAGKKSKEKPPSGAPQGPPKTIADALREVGYAARAVRMQELADIAANLDLIKSGNRIGEALEKLDGASMGGGRLNYLGVWNTVSAVRNHPQHGAAARRLLAKWAAAADEEAQREAVRNSLRTAGAAQAPACSQAPQCSGGEAAKENTAPLPATVVNEPPTTPGRAPNDASQQGGLGGAAPQETSGAPDVAVKFEEQSTQLSLSSYVAYAQGRHEATDDADPPVSNGIVKTEPRLNPDDLPVEAVEALAAAIVALAEEEQTAPTVKIEPPPTPVNTPNAYGQLFAAQNGTASLGQT